MGCLSQQQDSRSPNWRYMLCPLLHLLNCQLCLRPCLLTAATHLPHPPTNQPEPSPTQVHGTCLGFEALAIIISCNTSILSTMDAENAPAPLLYTELAAGSDWLQALPPHVVSNLQNQALAMENHQNGERMCVRWTVCWSRYM